MADYNLYWNGAPPDTVEVQVIINEMPVAIGSAMWFWLVYKICVVECGAGTWMLKELRRG